MRVIDDNQGVDPSEVFEMLDSATAVVASMTGLKSKYIESGWTNEGAEQAALLVIKSSMEGWRRKQ